MADKITRCAIYTRKSTEEGLEKEFNSLEAQREACEAYIKSQRHEGWVLIPAYYDDGGYTGGNMERPALRALMADIRAGKVDVIVVYKVDRLSRSLHDFAQMVAVFDAQKVSFVSITQQFNTTTSMGRLTLNILLSFAQFEREVIGERVRDKIAASKRKGMWMGGFPPLGYDIEERKLTANLPEAALVCTIFERYIEMRSGFKVAQWLNENGHQNKRWINRNGVVSGGHPFCGQAVYKILNNPIYIGMIRHHENIYEGQHQGILPLELWEQAQSLLKTGREKRKKRYVKHGMLLAGKCFSAAGEIYTPTYTTRGAKHYRYYEAKAEHRRVNALEVEAVVVDTIRMLAREPAHWKQCWQKHLPEMGISDAQRCWERHWENWQEFTAHEKQNAMGGIIQRIVIAEESLTLRLSYAGIAERVRFAEALTDGESEKPDCAFRPTVTIHDEGIELEVWAKFQLQGRKQRVMDEAGRPLHNAPKSQCNPVLVNAVVKSYRWNRQLERGDKTITQLAAEAGLGRTYVSRIITLIYLAPDILSAILKGTQPSTLQLQHLLDNLPVEWSAQRAKLGMA